MYNTGKKKKKECEIARRYVEEKNLRFKRTKGEQKTTQGVSGLQEEHRLSSH